MVVAKQLGAMEHALSLPQTRFGRSQQLDEPSDTEKDDSRIDQSRPAQAPADEARPPEPADDEEPIGPAVHTARTLPDPLQEPDRESTIFASPSAKIVLGHGDELPDPAPRRRPPSNRRRVARRPAEMGIPA